MGTLKLSNVSSPYGAPMGRRDSHADDRTRPIKFALRRVYLDSGGYDNGGAYWGIGAPLYQASGEYGEDADGGAGEYVEFYLRAHGREDAKAKIRADYPAARFYR